MKIDPSKKRITNDFFGKYTYAFLLLIVVGVFFLFCRFTVPFYGWHLTNDIRFTTEAKFLLENGYCTYLSHPLLLEVFLSVSYYIFGIHYWSARLVPIISTLLSGIVLYYLSKLIYNKKTGLLSVTFFFTSPFIIFFGQKVQLEPLVIFFILSCFYTYYKFLETKKRRFLLFSSISIFLGSWVDYPCLLAVIPILVISHSRKQWKGLVAIALSGAVAIFSWLITFLIFSEENLNVFFGHGAHWINFYQYFENPYYYYRYFSYIVYFPTLLIIFFVLSLVTLKFNEKNKFLFYWAITYFLYSLFIFKATANHGYHLIYLILPMCIMTSHYLNEKYNEREISMIILINVALFLHYIIHLFNIK